MTMMGEIFVVVAVVVAVVVVVVRDVNFNVEMEGCVSFVGAKDLDEILLMAM
jgi:hypothetical protein